MTKTFLFGEINSRKKYNRKIVISAFVDNGVLDMRIVYYEKKSKRWEFITDNPDDINCGDKSFIEIRNFYKEFNNKFCNENELKTIFKENENETGNNSNI